VDRDAVIFKITLDGYDFKFSGTASEVKYLAIAGKNLSVQFKN